MFNEIEDALKQAECMNDTREELIFVASQAKQHIHSWKSHLLRSTNQDDCRLDIIKELDETSVLLVLDWAMKHLPRKFRESQTNCELVKNLKLSTFSIKMLQDICSSFGLNVSKITIKRKKPHIDLLTNVVMGCKCQMSNY